MKHLHEKLKELRNERAYSQQNVADALGITRSAYANYEQGLREPSLDTFQKICQFYEIDAEFFWE